ncbi:25999_t:CDS:2, partial [Gigaspora margarita]
MLEEINTTISATSNASLINTDTSNNISNDVQEKAYYCKKAKNKNTERSTKNWIMKFEEFHTSSGYLNSLTELSNLKQIEKEIVEFISSMKKKMHSRIDRSNPINLLYRIFIRLSILLAIRSGEHYQLQVNQFKIDRNGGLQFFHYTSKNNQRGLQKGQAQVISIPLDTVEQEPSDPEFYLQPNSNWLESGIWYKKNHVEKNKLINFMHEIGHITKINIPIESLTNYSGRKTAAQCLQDHNIPEQAIIQLTEHKSIQGIYAYKQVNEVQQVHTINTLINITDGLTNDNNNL